MSQHNLTKDEITEIINGLGYFHNIQPYTGSLLSKRKLHAAFTFVETINEVETTMIVGFDIEFPLSMPSYFIKEYDSYKFIPHIERDGKVCYTHDDYVFLDADRPSEIITETHELAKNTIEKGLKNENTLDFANEFEAYWNRIDGHEEIWGNINLVNTPEIISVGFRSDVRFAVSSGNNHAEIIGRFVDLEKKGITYQNAFFIPLTLFGEMVPPKYCEPVSISYVKSLLDMLGEKERKQLNKLLQGTTKKEEYVFFSFKQPNGAFSIFGIKFSHIKSSGHPLIATEFEGQITPVNIQRIDKEYLYQRGGTGECSSNKKGLIIGGGSVGGFITEELVRNGFFDLTIVDRDDLSSDNCYRHLTGFTHIGKNKAAAIKLKVERYYPHCKITSIETGIEESLRKKKIDISLYDFIVVATGNVTVNTYLNKIFIHEFPGKPVFYSWNDPYGIGGHCLVTNIEPKGCYRCIYTNDDYYNMASFAHNKQTKTFLKNVSGCGSVYTPYGSIHSVETCLITVKKIIEVMNGRIDKNGIYSWKGDSTVFLKEGFNTSERFKMTEAELDERKNSFANDKCTACKKI